MFLSFSLLLIYLKYWSTVITDRGYLLLLFFFFFVFFFQCEIEFYFTEWTPKAVFSRVAVATSENTGFGVHEWNKIRCYTEKKIKFSVSFMLLFAIIKLLPTLRLSSGGSHEWKYRFWCSWMKKKFDLTLKKKSNFLFLLCFYLQ